MEPRMPVARLRLLIALLVGASALWLFTTSRTWALENSLTQEANAKVADLSSHLVSVLPRGHDVVMASQVTAAQDYLVFGHTHGKVTVYLRSVAPFGRTHFGAYDYFYEYDGEHWIEKESGYCGDRESIVEAKAVFASLR